MIIEFYKFITNDFTLFETSENLENNILLEFDDGFYWEDLKSDFDRDECKAMNYSNIKSAYSDTLISLRFNGESHLTASYDSNGGIIYNILGRGNTKPDPKYHKYIYKLLVSHKINNRDLEYDEDLFNLMDFDKSTFSKVFTYNPNLIYNSINDNIKLLKPLLEKDYIDKIDIIDTLKTVDEINLVLVLTILEDYNDILNKDEMKDIIDSEKNNISDIGELGKLKMYRYGLISKNKLASYYSDLSVQEDKLVLLADKDDLESFFEESLISFVIGDYDFDPYWEKLERSEYVLDYLSKENLDTVISNMVGVEISEPETTIEKEMFVWDEKHKTYDFIYDNVRYDLDDIIDDNKDDLSDLFDSLERIANYANETAQYDEYHKYARKAIEEKFGEYNYTSIKNGNRTYDYISFDFEESIPEIIDFLVDDYTWDGELDYKTENYGNIWYILKEIKYDSKEGIPDYIYASASRENINDAFSNEL